LIVAGLRGGGWQGRAEDLVQVEIEGGPLAAARAAAELVVRAFALPDQA
ncbi:MAG: GTA-gp10 family protein, partial [Pseudomonadota bacterium]|nr:GTA-gp10 family protein [Pseudomonadota bacterium]